MNRFEYLNRLREPSTWAGIGILLSLVGINLAPPDAQAFVNGGVGLASLLAIFIGEKR